jgi:hypothetical protein
LTHCTGAGVSGSAWWAALPECERALPGYCPSDIEDVI